MYEGKMYDVRRMDDLTIDGIRNYVIRNDWIWELGEVIRNLK